MLDQSSWIDPDLARWLFIVSVAAGGVVVLLAVAGPLTRLSLGATAGFYSAVSTGLLLVLLTADETVSACGCGGAGISQYLNLSPTWSLLMNGVFIASALVLYKRTKMVDLVECRT